MVSGGVKVIRYADDIVVLLKSKRAAKRLLETCRRYLDDKLKLNMNAQKSKVVSVLTLKHFKCLGFCLGKNGKGIYIRAHRESLAKEKRKLKELTSRNQGMSVGTVMKKVKSFIQGGLGYYQVAGIPVGEYPIGLLGG